MLFEIAASTELFFNGVFKISLLINSIDFLVFLFLAKSIKFSSLSIPINFLSLFNQFSNLKISVPGPHPISTIIFEF